MEPFNLGTFPFLVIWWCALHTAQAQYREMTCEDIGSRHARKMTEPGPECDMRENNWCIEKTSNYPEQMIMEVILDNRGIMKRLFGDHREARLLRDAFSNHVDDSPQRPPPFPKRRKNKKPTISTQDRLPEDFINGRFPQSEILSSIRHGKKIDDNRPLAMQVGSIDGEVVGSKDNRERDDNDTNETTPTDSDGINGARPLRNNDVNETRPTDFSDMNEGSAPKYDNGMNETKPTDNNRMNVVKLKDDNKMTGGKLKDNYDNLRIKTKDNKDSGKAWPKDDNSLKENPRDINGIEDATSGDATDVKLSETQSTTTLPPSRANDKVFADDFDTQIRITKPPTGTQITVEHGVTEATFSSEQISTERVTNLDLPEISEEKWITEASFPVEDNSDLEMTTQVTFSQQAAITPSPFEDSEGIQLLDKDSTASLENEPATTQMPQGDSENGKLISLETSTGAFVSSLTLENNILPKDSVKKTETTEHPLDNLRGRGEFEAIVEKPRKPLRTSIYPRPNVYSHRPGYGSRNPPLRERTEPLSSTTNDVPMTRPPETVPTSPPPPPPSPAQINKFPACNSTSEVIAPTWARNTQGKNLIVVNVGGFMQHLHIEKCEKGAIYRKMYCRMGCRCEQQYRLQKLLVIDPNDECRGIFSDWFRFPSCCTCVCYSNSKQLRVTGRSARIMDEELFYGDEEEEFLHDEIDLTDPFIRHYLSLEEEEEKTWNNLQEEASEPQPQYKSFTDIASIDRSFHSDYSLNGKEMKAHRLSPRTNTIYSKSHSPRPKATLSESRRNSSRIYTLPEKKSRLLFREFNHTINIRPQIAPRRIPPRRTPISNLRFPWLNSQSFALWPSLSIYRKFPSLGLVRSLPRDSSPFANVVTSRPTKIRASTLGTLNTATSPYFKWNWENSLSKINQEKSNQNRSFVLSRIPRNTQGEG